MRDTQRRASAPALIRWALVCALASTITSFLTSAQGQSAATRRPYPTGDIVLGAAEAPVEILLYGSISCLPCRQFHADVLPKLKARYVLSGEARFIWRTYPSDPVPVAMAAAALARCSGEDNYYAMIGDMFAAQAAILEAARAGGAARRLMAIAARHGLSPESAESCLSDPEIERELQEENRRAPRIERTPALYVNGRPVSDPSFVSLEAAITAALKNDTSDMTLDDSSEPAPIDPPPLRLRPRHSQ